MLETRYYTTISKVMLYGREIIHNVQLSILNVRLCKTPSPDGLHHFYQCNPINFAREKFP